MQAALASALLVSIAVGCGALGFGETRCTVGGAQVIVRQASVYLGIVNDELDCRTDHGNLRTLDGRILLNDVDYGPIMPGDELVWQRNGDVEVNGEERGPTE